MKIAVLAVQGAFIEHEKKLEALGAQCIELRKKEDLNTAFDGLVLPGGESTVQGKLLRELGMFDILKEKIEDGMPVFAICAGLILLAEHLTTVQVFNEELGARLALQILYRIKYPNTPHEITYLGTNVLYRDSTGD